MAKKTSATKNPLSNLTECRKKIDRIDEKVIELLDERAQVARRVGEIKAKSGDDFFDAGRHLKVLNSIRRRGSGDFPPEGLRNVYGEILSVCLNLQSPQTIGFLGTESGFAQIAARRAFGRSPAFVSFDSIADVFKAALGQQVHFGIVPVENSSEGVFHDTLDELMTTELSITAEIFIPVRYDLLGQGSLDKVRRVTADTQSLAACHGWLRTHLPKAKLIETASELEGWKRAMRTATTASIGSPIASETASLKKLAGGIEDKKDNVTRFLALGFQNPHPSGNDRTSVMFSIKDEPAALFNMLKPFADRKINMTHIESRATGRRPWEYLFFADMEGHISQPEIKRVVKNMGKHCHFLRVLGSYPVDRQRDVTRG